MHTYRHQTVRLCVDDEMNVVIYQRRHISENDVQNYTTKDRNAIQ